MRFASNTWWTKGFLIGALLAVPAVANAGDDAFPNADDGVFLAPPRDISSREILLSADTEELPESSFRDHLYFTKKRGVEYRHVITTENQKLFLQFYGPVIKKKPGLGFELNGLKLGGFEIRMRGYGSMKKAGFLVNMTF